MKSNNCPTFKKLGVHGKLIAVDLDDTLLKGCGSIPGEPLPGIVEDMRLLKAMGFTIMIHTARINDGCEEEWGPQEGVVKEVLNRHGIPFDEIWTGRGKPTFCHVIDDKSYVSVADFIKKIKDGTIDSNQ